MTNGMRYVLIIFLFVLTSVPAVGQEGSGQKFIRITHSVDGTVAVDSAGDTWFYDSEQGEFVKADEYEKRRSAGSAWWDEDEAGADDILLPPEERCTDIHYGDITDILNDIVIGIDERVEGSVTGGRDVIIKGLVTGDVVSLQTVIVTGTGEVRGDVMAKEIRRERGGRILGHRQEVPFPKIGGIKITQYVGVMPGFVSLFITGFMIFLCVIIIAIIPNNIKRIVAKVRNEIVKSFFWGLLVWFSILPVFVLLLITIVGIPVALLAYPLIIVAALALAYAAVAICLGEGLCPLFGWQDRSIYIKGICGVIALEACRNLWVFCHIVGMSFLGDFLLPIFIIIYSLAMTIGIGAVVSTRFGVRPKKPGVEPARPVPPTPPVSPPPPLSMQTPGPETLTSPPPPSPPPPPDSKNATE